MDKTSLSLRELYHEKQANPKRSSSDQTQRNQKPQDYRTHRGGQCSGPLLNSVHENKPVEKGQSPVETRGDSYLKDTNRGRKLKARPRNKRKTKKMNHQSSDSHEKKRPGASPPHEG
ncbi:hypothetical protein C922_05087 [Plasmodium inui San Antonio 1]|uniref:Uncharacterized protein n=1 Tax=Plasmodium inui San Antonio 1 TaxID=1237626 RepID=W6ZZ39_9APIC|nr:hypothetical protein C922_05087 [Plasmodium inui San Antonio 1]EUD64525.1 hypothetical protein C922_05087 [Plasmodium inui San Antonio 1]